MKNTYTLKDLSDNTIADINELKAYIHIKKSINIRDIPNDYSMTPLEVYEYARLLGFREATSILSYVKVDSVAIQLVRGLFS